LRFPQDLRALLDLPDCKDQSGFQDHPDHKDLRELVEEKQDLLDLRDPRDLRGLPDHQEQVAVGGRVTELLWVMSPEFCKSIILGDRLEFIPVLNPDKDGRFNGNS